MQISIPQPCPASWSDMQPNTGGRHCTQCNKTVIDFTVMTEEQVKTYFANAGQRVCGRFERSQLSPPPRKHRWRLLAYGLGSLAVSLFSFQKTFAQDSKEMPDTSKTTERVSVLGGAISTVSKVILNIVDDNGNPIIGPSIQTRYTGKRIIYTISALGYETRTIPVRVPSAKSAPKRVTVHMNQHDVLAGDVVITEEE